MNRTLLTLAVVALPNLAAAQRFAGVMDASGMVARPTAPPTATPIPGLGMLAPGNVLLAPARPGFFTPGIAPQLVPSDSAVLNNVVQPVFIPAPAIVTPSEVIEEEPLGGEVLPALRSDARMLSARRPTSVFRTPGPTVFAPVVASTTGSASGRCQTAAVRQLRASNVQPDDLRFDANSTGLATLNGAEVRGGGILLNRGQWRRFRYVCDSSPTAQTRAVVTFGPAR